MLNLSLIHTYFEFIKSGRKTIEGRINTPKFENLKPGDKIIFTSHQTQETLSCIVTRINRYADFESMLRYEGVENLLPDITNIKTGVQVYEALPGYKEKVTTFGAISITITCSKDQA